MPPTTTGDPPPPPPPSIPINHRTTPQILKQSLLTITSTLPTILFLALLLISFRSLVENGSLVVSSILDRDPALRSLVDRLDTAASSNKITYKSRDMRRRGGSGGRRKPFLHLTRVGTLDEDLISGDEDEGNGKGKGSMFGGGRGVRVNGSVVDLRGFEVRLGFEEGFVVGNGVRVSEVVRSGVEFRIEGEIKDNKGSQVDGDGGIASQDMSLVSNSTVEGDEGVVDLGFLMAGLELGRRDAAALFFLVFFFSAAYGWVILAFVITYSWVLGIVFVTVLNNLLGRDISFWESVWSGSRLGLKKLSGFIVMKWAVRDALTQVLGLWYFGEIEDQYSFLKLILRLKLMPFSATMPPVVGIQKEVSGFLVAWFWMDTIVSFLFAVDSWVTIVSFRRRGSEIVKEGCGLLGVMFQQAVRIKGIEIIACGSIPKFILDPFCGRSVAIVFRSLMEVYFMVVWLVFYLSAKYKDASLSGRRFGRRELVGLIEGLR
ncbi:hypothetical protein Droror1_Dr00013889 [Drosera rotundifolia]